MQQFILIHEHIHGTSVESFEANFDATNSDHWEYICNQLNLHWEPESGEELDVVVAFSQTVPAPGSVEKQKDTVDETILKVVHGELSWEGLLPPERLGIKLRLGCADQIDVVWQLRNLRETAGVDGGLCEGLESILIEARVAKMGRESETTLALHFDAWLEGGPEQREEMINHEVMQWFGEEAEVVEWNEEHTPRLVDDFQNSVESKPPRRTRSSAR